MEYYTSFASPVGALTLACHGEEIVGSWLEDQKYFPNLSSMLKKDDHPLLIQACDWLARYFCVKRPDPKELPLSPKGSPFQKTVWNELLNIPYGATITYGQLAAAIRKPGAYQAVGGAVGRNPISIIIPCHRVVGAKGKLTGYAGGINAKEYLLSHEIGPNSFDF